MSIDELKPGESTDVDVAQAVGLELGSPEDFPLRCYIDGKLRTFAPSTDLNDAFWAAEKLYLFNADFDPHVLIHHTDQHRADGWCIHRLNDSEENELVFDESPAMAICKAILKLKSLDVSHLLGEEIKYEIISVPMTDQAEEPNGSDGEEIEQA